VYFITASNSGSVGNGFWLRRYISNMRQVVSSTAETFRSPGPSMLLVLYFGFNLKLVLAGWLVGVLVCGSSVRSNRRRGEDSKRRGEDACDSGVLGDIARCEADEDGCIVLPILEGGPWRIPTDSILAEGDIVIWVRRERACCCFSSSCKASVSRNVDSDELELSAMEALKPFCSPVSLVSLASRVSGKLPMIDSVSNVCFFRFCSSILVMFGPLLPSTPFRFFDNGFVTDVGFFADGFFAGFFADDGFLDFLFIADEAPDWVEGTDTGSGLDRSRAEVVSVVLR